MKKEHERRWFGFGGRWHGDGCLSLNAIDLPRAFKWRCVDAGLLSKGW